MGLALGHMIMEGINVNAELLFMVTSINVYNRKIGAKIINRIYNIGSELPNWREQERDVTLNLNEKVELTSGLYTNLSEIKSQYDSIGNIFPSVRMNYEAPKKYSIARVNFRKVEYSWRRAFKDDGIFPDMFGLETREFYVEKTDEKTERGLQLFYVWAVEPRINKDIAFYIINNKGKYELIARIVEGKIVTPKLENNAHINYPFERITYEKYLRFLAQNRHLLLDFYAKVPSGYPFMKETSDTLKRVKELSNELKAGNANKNHIEDLIWSCK